MCFVRTHPQEADFPLIRLLVVECVVFPQSHWQTHDTFTPMCSPLLTTVSIPKRFPVKSIPIAISLPPHRILSVLELQDVVRHGPALGLVADERDHLKSACLREGLIHSNEVQGVLGI